MTNKYFMRINKFLTTYNYTYFYVDNQFFICYIQSDKQFN